MEKEKKRKIKIVKKQLKFKGHILGIIIIIIIAIVAFNAIFAWGIYKLSWQNAVVEKIVEVLPYPAAKVNQQYISFADYLKNLRAAEKFYDQQKKAGSPAIPTDLELKKMALEQRLINNLLIETIADQYDVTVTDAEINNELDQLIAQKGSQQALAGFLQDFYDLNIQEYAKYFIRPNLYFDKTQTALQQQDLNFNDLLKEAIDKAQIKIYAY